ncbi:MULTISPECIES: hypothetical protein [Pseudomonas]|jgi:hypothetical protein|uniref:hypothetical protein n=1 Tax=Pseudomonas TaxID=286 RepID=UPI0003DD39CD|nr:MULTISPECIES: hypothetical protein [Pseudomonas]ETK20470.1 hypothetical protein H096_21303 [Pseudomonas sp. FH1]
MRDISVSDHISKSVAVEYIAAAAMGNVDFEARSICGFDVDFVDVQSGLKEHHSERLARVVACNQERTIVAVGFVSPADN